MHSTTLGRGLAAALITFTCGATVMAQDSTPNDSTPSDSTPGDSTTTVSTPGMVYVHLAHVADAFDGTPNGWGLLPTALAEAEIALQHAELAASDSTDLEGMKRHVEHVLHAIDPSPGQSGPGLGYGVRQAASGVAEHIELAAGVEGASDNVAMHARYVAGAARSAAARVERIEAVAARVRSATSAAAAAPVVEELNALVRALLIGNDADGDGLVGWAPPEGGVRQALYHTTLLRRGEGLIQ